MTLVCMNTVRMLQVFVSQLFCFFAARSLSLSLYLRPYGIVLEAHNEQSRKFGGTNELFQ